MNDIPKVPANENNKAGWLWLLPIAVGLFLLILPFAVGFLETPKTSPGASPNFDWAGEAFCNVITLITGATGKTVAVGMVLAIFVVVLVRWIMSRPLLRRWLYAAISAVLVLTFIYATANIIVALDGRIAILCCAGD